MERKPFMRGAPFVILGALFLLVDILQRLFGQETLVAFLETTESIDGWFALLVVFLVVSETLFVVSFYVPGSLALLILSLSFRDDLQELTKLLILYWAGVSTGVYINYIIGRYASTFVRKLGHRSTWQSAQRFFLRYGNLAVVLFSMHPNYIGTLFLAFGVTSTRIKRQPIFFLASMVASSIVFVSFVHLLPISSSSGDFPISAFQFSIVCIGVGIAIILYDFWKDQTWPRN